MKDRASPPRRVAADPFRAGPWPGLTVPGAGVLLACAALLAGALAVLGEPRQAWPDVPFLGLSSVLPLAIATRITRLPGAASATCGAYLLARTLLSLINPGLDLPPLLLVPAVVLDLALWLRAADFARLTEAWPNRQLRWRRKPPPTRRQASTLRAAAAGGSYGAALSLVVPPWAILLGSDPARFSAVDTPTSLAATVALCAATAAVLVSGRDTGS